MLKSDFLICADGFHQVDDAGWQRVLNKDPMLNVQSLNPPQRQAVETIDGPLMLLAGAGTGKTRVITYRIANMIAHGVPPNRIIGLTFTNKAAREMSERVRELVGATGKSVFLGTFHSFCIKLLRRFHRQAGLSKQFTLIGSSDQIDLVRRALDEKNWSGLYKPADLHAGISQAKNQLILPDQVAHASGLNAPDLSVLAEIYRIYERQLRLNRVIDFDDCILRTVMLLQDQAEVRQSVHNLFSHYLVDEFQDTNLAQLTLIEHLVGSDHNICVVGDDDQSIYSWRGAMYETLERFEELFPTRKLIKLEQNYRCTDLILKAANNVIKNNSKRKDKTLWSENLSEQPIDLACLANDTDEARWIAERCYGLLGQGKRPRDIGILYRANVQGRALELALREKRLRYQIFGGQSFFERKEVKDFLAYLRLLHNPDDRLAFWRVINTPQRGFGLKTLEAIEALAQKHKLSPFRVIEQHPDKLPKRAADAGRAFIETFITLRQLPMTTSEELATLSQEILRRFRLEEDIRQRAPTTQARDRKVEILRRLPSWIRESAERYLEDNNALDMHDLLDALTLSDDNRSNEDKQNTDSISLMTIHASKGLEFPVVFLCGCEEELLPHKNSAQDPHGIAEERRLFYVAITRAKERLFITHTRERYSGFQKQPRKVSRYISEIPPSILNVIDKFSPPTQSEDERRKQTITRLSGLSSLIKGGFSDHK